MNKYPNLFFESSVDPSSKEDPVKYGSMRVLRTFLQLIGAWPGEMFAEHVPLLAKCHRTMAPVLTFVALLGQINYIVQYSSKLDFLLLGHCYINTFLCVLTLVRCTLPSFKNYGAIIKASFTNFHVGLYKHKGSYYVEMSNVVDKICLWLTAYFVGVAVFCVILYNVPPFIQNLLAGAFKNDKPDNVTLQFTVYFVYPGFQQEDFPVISTLICLYLAIICSIGINATDLLLYTMLFQIYGHIQILRNDLETMPKPQRQQLNGPSFISRLSVEMFNNDENEMIHSKLVDCVNHHRMIVSFAADMSAFFGPVLGMNYAFHMVGCCLLLLECASGDRDAVICFGLLTMTVFGQLIQMSVIFELVGTMSEKLEYSVYQTPWECMNTRNRRTVCILLDRVQTPIHVTAMGMTTIGVATMTSILKTTFSYFLFLRSIA